MGGKLGRQGKEGRNREAVRLRTKMQSADKKAFISNGRVLWREIYLKIHTGAPTRDLP